VSLFLSLPLGTPSTGLMTNCLILAVVRSSSSELEPLDVDESRYRVGMRSLIGRIV